MLMDLQLDASEIDPAARELLQTLSQQLKQASADLDQSGSWPEQQLRWCAEAGVFRWFIPTAYGGWEWNEQQLLTGYLALSQSCLTTTFVLTQWNAACRRILASTTNQQLKQRLLPKMADGNLFATVGISHLSTSRQHLGKPVLAATPQPDGSFVLDGYTPWVTGAAHADVIVTGATLADGRQLLGALPATRAGIKADVGQPLVALSASCTDQVRFSGVRLEESEVIAGPENDVMQSGSGGGAGGLQTSTLAIGLAMAAVGFIEEQSARRSDLQPVFQKLRDDTAELHAALVQLTAGNSAKMNAAQLRQHANSLALRSTQAALSAAKGAGFLATHPAGRMAREAMFFLVWSCPQPVVTANLCELAQLG